jgi:murein DD-endopeptidase MepM/ murein hydrolase activator NlpD
MARLGMDRWPARGGMFGLSLAAALACSESSSAAPDPAAAPKPAAQPAAGGTPAASPAVVHVVKEGETLWDIARAYGVSVEAILQASGLQERQVRRMSKGTQLRIPGKTQAIDVLASKQKAAEAQAPPPIRDGAYHYLQRGETLWDVARTYEVPIEKLMKRNTISEDALPTLRIGQAIAVPGIKASDVKSSDRKPARGFMHEMKPGETVWDVAHRYGVSVAEIMSANRLSEAEVTNIRDGTRVFLPGVVDDGRGRVRRQLTGGQRRAQTVAGKLGLGTLAAAGALLHGRVKPHWIRAADAAGPFPGTLRWPVANGWFVRGYGSGQGGYHKAMDISGKIGWHVRAAAPGVVGYSGDQVSGFGNMVMVVHSGGWVTLYAHNSVNFVVAGERVARGDILAEVGSTGRSQGPHVHFELIHRSNNCDPAPLFRPGVRKRTGAVMKYDYTRWRLPDQRPRAVRCARRQKHPVGKSVVDENPTLDVTPEAVNAPELAKPPPDDANGEAP